MAITLFDPTTRDTLASPHPQVAANAALIGFEQMSAQISAWALVQHNADGTHNLVSLLPTQKTVGGYLRTNLNGTVTWSTTAVPDTSTIGDLWYASQSNNMAALPIGSSGQFLSSNGTIPAWSSATFPLSVNTGDLLYGSATNVLSQLPVGATADYLRSNGTAPAWSALNAADLTGSHTLPDGVLSSNVPLLNAANTFTAAQQISGAALTFGTANSTWTSYDIGRAGNALQFNGGSSGYGWNNSTNSVELMALTDAGVLSVNGFGAHTFSAGGTGGNVLQLVNTTAGIGNYAQLNVGTDVSAAQTRIVSLSSTYTTGTWDVQAGSAFVGTGAGGVSIAAINASGAIRFYTGGVTQRGIWDHSGNLGIGVTGPSAVCPLQVGATAPQSTGLTYVGTAPAPFGIAITQGTPGSPATNTTGALGGLIYLEQNVAGALPNSSYFSPYSGLSTPCLFINTQEFGDGFGVASGLFVLSTSTSGQNATVFSACLSCTAGSTTVTNSANSFTSSMVGMYVYITGGTGGWVNAMYQINSVSSASTAVFSSSPCPSVSGSAGNGHIATSDDGSGEGVITAGTFQSQIVNSHNDNSYNRDIWGLNVIVKGYGPGTRAPHACVGIEVDVGMETWAAGGLPGVPNNYTAYHAQCSGTQNGTTGFFCSGSGSDWLYGAVLENCRTGLYVYTSTAGVNSPASAMEIRQNYTGGACWAGTFYNTTTAGVSNGLYVQAGTNASDGALSVWNASAGTQLFLVRGDGLVGIGCYPSYTLDVIGTIRAQGAVTGGNTPLFINTSNGFRQVVLGNDGQGATPGYRPLYVAT